MELADRFYSAPEVANILGVTLRSLYRYIRDGKIETFKTAGGRLRFTREAVLGFMGPSIRKEQVVYRQPVSRVPSYYPASAKQAVRYKEELEEINEEEELEKVVPVRSVPARRPIVRREETAPVKTAAKSAVTTSLYEEDASLGSVEKEVEEKATRKLFYQSNTRDLRLLAQKVQKSCQNAHVPYALTGYAGMSLHREMPPFSVIHIYVNFDDLPFFENILQCHEVPNEDDANLCFLEVSDLNFWQNTETFKGFKVAVPQRLEEDLKSI